MGDNGVLRRTVVLGHGAILTKEDSFAEILVSITRRLSGCFVDLWCVNINDIIDNIFVYIV